MYKEKLYSGTLTFEMYDGISEVLDDLSTEWIDAEVDMLLERETEESREYNVLIQGPETNSLLNPFSTSRPTDSYIMDEESAEYLQEFFSEY